MNEDRASILRTKRNARSPARHDVKADDLLVILERSLEIAHEQTCGSKARFGWKSVTRRGNAVLHRPTLAMAVADDHGCYATRSCFDAAGISNSGIGDARNNPRVAVPIHRA